MRDNRGFTLVEAIIVLIFVSLLSGGIGTMINLSIEGYLFNRNSAATSQKAQLALSRISRELIDLTDITTASASVITYVDAAGAVFRLSLANGQVTLERTSAPAIAARELITGLVGSYGPDSFLTYSKADGSNWTITDDLKDLHAIQVRLKLQGYGELSELEFTTSINPRGNPGVNMRPNAPLLS
jgi:hypothetical protein